MTLITCEECLHKVVCPIYFSYKDVLNVKNYCEHFANKSALEKQIPKKPIRKNPICYEKTKDGQEYFAFDYFCPNCNGQIKTNDHHCRCGQALDWGDRE